MRVGEYDLASREGEQDCDQDGWCAPLPQDFTPVQVLVHPDYNKPSKFQNDIAVIKLDRDVAVNGNCQSQPFYLTSLPRLRLSRLSALLRDDDLVPGL